MKSKIILIFCVCLLLFSCATSQSRVAKARLKDPRYQYNMGLFYLNSNQLDLSIKHLKESLSLEAQNHLALNALGLAFSMKGNLDESAKYFTECLKINPALSEAHNNLGSVYQEMGHMEKAEEHFVAASLDTQYSSRELPFYNLARLYFTQEKLTEALYQVQRSLDIKKDFPLALNLEGKIYSKLGRMAEAVASFEKALEINPGDLDVDFNLAEAYFNNRQFEKAKQKFNSLYLQTNNREMKQKIESYLKKIR